MRGRIWLPGRSSPEGATRRSAPFVSRHLVSNAARSLTYASTCGAILLEGTLLALAGFRSYDPIRCQEATMAPPTACNRSAGPAVNPSRSAPGMSSTPSAQSHIRGYRSVGPHSIPSAGFPKSVEAHAGGLRAHSEIGVSPKAARLAGTGLCLFRALPAHHAEGPEPPHELGRGGRVGLRRGHAAGEHLLAPPQEPLGPPSSRASLSRGDARVLGMSFGWCRAAA